LFKEGEENMKKSPIVCNCSSCECGIYTYEDTNVCKACQDGKHLSGAKKKSYDTDSSSQQKPELKI